MIKIRSYADLDEVQKAKLKILKSFSYRGYNIVTILGFFSSSLALRARWCPMDRFFKKNGIKNTTEKSLYKSFDTRTLS